MTEAYRLKWIQGGIRIHRELFHSSDEAAGYRVCIQTLYPGFAAENDNFGTLPACLLVKDSRLLRFAPLVFSKCSRSGLTAKGAGAVRK